MEMLLEGNVVVITGCSRGIGLSTVKKFLEHGAKVYAIVRDEKSSDLLRDLAQLYCGSVVPLCLDVRDTARVKDVFIKIRKDDDRLDCLVNNAGILVDTTLPMLNRTTLRDIYEVNVFSIFEFMSYAARIMGKRKHGSIINIASICGDEGGMRGQTAYSSSKGAVIALTKTAAKELGELGIRVNAVSPGFIDTDMFRSGPPRIQERLINGVYLGSRVGKPEEVADVCLFLASKLSSYITGENIRVDGFSHI